jgi:hypothetical protein
LNGISELTSTATNGESLSPAKAGSEHRSENMLPKRKPGITNIVLASAFCMSVADWFSAIRSPLWLDETNSYYQISGGFWQIWARHGLSFPAYSYILWISKSVLGSNEVLLRMPSVFAMLAAVYVLYLIAREFFEFDVAVIVTIVFCMHPIVSFAAIDARPYAFGVLTVNCAILSLLRWMRSNSTRHAIMFGIALAGIFYFHYLFSVIIAAFVVLFLAFKRREWKSFVPKLAIGLAPFTLMMLPVIPQLVWMVRTRESHVYADAPRTMDLLSTVAPGNIALALMGAVACIAVVTRKLAAPEHERDEAILTCVLLAAAPLATLYAVSLLTTLHIFLERYRLVALPGVALCWGLLVSRLNSKFLRVLFCVSLVAFTFSELPCSTWKPHGYSWKDALEVADKNAASDHAALLVCSGLRESSFEPMPADAKGSPLFSPLSYYKVNSSVIPLPRDFNSETRSQVNKFLAMAIPARQRFLVLAHPESMPAEHWITVVTKEHYQARQLGVYDEVTVMEYVPR